MTIRNQIALLVPGGAEARDVEAVLRGARYSSTRGGMLIPLVGADPGSESTRDSDGMLLHRPSSNPAIVTDHGRQLRRVPGG